MIGRCPNKLLILLGTGLLLPIPGGLFTWYIGKRLMDVPMGSDRAWEDAVEWSRSFLIAPLIILLLFAVELFLEYRLFPGDEGGFSWRGIHAPLAGILFYGVIFFLLYFWLPLSVAGVSWLSGIGGSAVCALSLGLLRGLFGLCDRLLRTWNTLSKKEEKQNENRASHQ